MEKGRAKAEVLFHFFLGRNEGSFFKANEIHLLSGHQILAHLLRVDIIARLRSRRMLPDGNDWRPEIDPAENFKPGS
jgi:hypothetical protein